MPGIHAELPGEIHSQAFLVLLVMCVVLQYLPQHNSGLFTEFGNHLCPVPYAYLSFLPKLLAGDRVILTYFATKDINKCSLNALFKNSFSSPDFSCGSHMCPG